MDYYIKMKIINFFGKKIFFIFGDNDLVSGMLINVNVIVMIIKDCFVVELNVLVL